MMLLRIEGVNLSHCIFDTEDLSTRRGGSLMLLDAVNYIAKEFNKNGKPKQLEQISTGASIGLFEVINCDPNELEKSVRKKLQEHHLFKFGTFVVNISEGEFKAACENVITENRWQQMQNLSFSVVGLKSNGYPPCTKDYLRPAAVESEYSASVLARRDYGRKQKQSFYHNKLSNLHLKSLAYTNEFSEIATNRPIEVDTQNLDGKMAVFYADGNKFGKVGMACKTSDDIKKWDDTVKKERRKLLEAIVAHAYKDTRWQRKKDEIRLETLLWGGDELMFVVPGWCGLQLAKIFFDQTIKMEYEGKKLTHACGLVFCHHQAPISSITKLAKNLADIAKNDSDDQSNTLNWIVLESFDYAGSDLNNYLKTRFENKVENWSDLTLSLEEVDELVLNMTIFKEVLPKSTMMRALRLLVKGDMTNPLLELSYQSVDATLNSLKSEEKEKFKILWKQIHPEKHVWTGKPPTAIKDATKDFSDLAAWVKLLELWDYCQPPCTHVAKVKNQNKPK